MTTSESYLQLAAERDRLRAINAELLAALKAAAGYMTNAAIDLQTGAPKRTALATINGGIAATAASIAKAEQVQS